MAELGIVASVIGVAGAGFRLSLILNAISCEVTNAPVEIHQISKTVTLFSLILKQTGNVLQAADSVHSHEAVEAAQQVANESTQVFDEINDMLDRVRTKRSDGMSQPSVQQRFKWCFKRNRIYYLLAQLDSLKLSLSLMLQIMQLGKLMSLTSKTDTPEQVKINTAAIQQERAEAQNTVIIRYIQIKEVDRLFRIAETGEEEMNAISPVSDSSQLTIEPPPEYTSSTALVRLPLHTLGEVDQMLSTIQNSSKDMVRVSDQAIDPLLDKWTRWHDAREERHRQASTRFVPKVDSLHEDDEDVPLYARYPDHDNNPRGFYLEGVTTDWRRPHSVEARREAAARRKKYSEYQPSVSTASTDVEDSPGSNASYRRRRTKRHVINSSSDSSEPEIEKPSKRRDSGVSSQGGRARTKPQDALPTLQRSQSATPKAVNLSPVPPVNGNQSLPSSYTTPVFSPPMSHRPYVTPDQQHLHHSFSSPLPPIHTSNAPNPYANSPTSPSSYYHPTSYSQLAPQYRPYDRAPQSRAPPRPLSRDGNNGRSPSRLSYDNSTNDYKRPRDDRYDRKDDRRDEKRKSKEKTKNLRDGAAKGLIGAGAIAGFLEALEGLSL